MRRIIIASSGFIVGMLAASCAPEAVPFLREDHCANQFGDSWCAERYPDGSRSFCARGTCGKTEGRDGCVQSRPVDDECYSPCGGRLSFPDDSSCLEEEASTGGSGTTSMESSTGPGTDDDPTIDPGCSNNDDCTSEASPFCEPSLGECVGCNAVDDPEACGQLDPSRPVCAGDLCVECTAEVADACVGDTPVCDAGSNTCVGCTAHDQCGEAACNLFTGSCLPGDAVVHVGAGQDFAAIGLAVGSFDTGAQGTIIVHDGDYAEVVAVDETRVLALLTAPGDQPNWDTPGIAVAPQLTVSDATVLMEGLLLSGNGSSASPGVRIDAGRAWIDRSRIVANVGGAIAAENGAELVTRNCFLGGDENDQDAVRFTGSTGRILYTTIGAGFGMASALACDMGSAVEVRNAIMVARTTDPEVQCDGAMVDTSVTEGGLGGTNTAVGDVDLAWFVDYPGGDFHLDLVPVPLANAGVWQQGDPAVDIDGDLRPEADGAPDVPGADVP